MPVPKKLSKTHRALIARYLTWAYKSTKESFDRLERKTTQLLVDQFIWEHLAKKSPTSTDPAYQALVAEYGKYIDDKKSQPVDVSRHQYLQDRLTAVEAAIVKFLGVAVLKRIEAQYEEEFTRRIWESKDH